MFITTVFENSNRDLLRAIEACAKLSGDLQTKMFEGKLEVRALPKKTLWFIMNLVESELLADSEAALEKAKIVTPEPIEIEDHSECQKAGKCLHQKPGKKKAHHG